MGIWGWILTDFGTIGYARLDRYLEVLHYRWDLAEIEDGQFDGLFVDGTDG